MEEVVNGYGLEEVILMLFFLGFVIYYQNRFGW